ncbi:MAG: monooxygenase, partial [Nocardioidaceae bacterium]|nr:monooxygenase [Nocardioidaceae bacterium]
ATLHSVVVEWLREFDFALAARDVAALERLFVADSYWRDIVSFTWDWGFVGSASEIARKLVAVADDIQPRDFRLNEKFTAPMIVTRIQGEVLEGFLEFETRHGHGRGLIRLVRDASAPSGFRGHTLLTTLRELYNRAFIEERPEGLGIDRSDTRMNWQDLRRKRTESFEDQDPEVLIIGGGHSGLMLAARLDEMNVDTLIVERFDRIGDNWRTRYESLALHTLTDLSHFPDMPFPRHFPDYLPKDKLGDWLEAYATSMELNYWTSTEFLKGDYDEDAERWTVTLRRPDGSIKTMHPLHVVVATGGISGTPHIPKLAGIDAFAGEVFHTEKFKSGAGYEGKNVLVVGMGTSAFDIAFDLYNHGAKVSMLQRTPTIYTTIDNASGLFMYFKDPDRSMDEKDVIAQGEWLYPLLIPALQEYTKYTAEIEKDMTDRLEAAGLRLQQGRDGTGYLETSWRAGGPYYLDVGCGEIIAQGKISIIQADTVDTYEAEGMVTKDGEHVPFDTIILSTGYLNLKEDVREYFGDDVAETVGEITGFDEQGEIRNAWRPTAQKGLWFMTGGLGQGRPNSVPFAVLLAAAVDGIMPGYRGKSPISR